jgi:hypothetical protein
MGRDRLLRVGVASLGMLALSAMVHPVWAQNPGQILDSLRRRFALPLVTTRHRNRPTARTSAMASSAPASRAARDVASTRTGRPLPASVSGTRVTTSASR